MKAVHILKKNHKFIKVASNIDDIVIDLMEILISLIKIYIAEADSTFEKRYNELSKIFLFFALSLLNERSDEIVRKIFKLWYQFMNLTIKVPRKTLLKKAISDEKLP